MPKFDITDAANSDDATTIYKIRDLLALCPAFWEIANVAASAAAAKIIVGIHARPESGETYTNEELKALFCVAQLFNPVPSQKIVYQSAGGPVPESGGVHELMIHRYCTGEEIGGHEARNDTYIWFYDRICRLQRWLLEEAERSLCPRLSMIQPVCEGAYGLFGETTAQGEFLWARMVISWGDEAQGQA